MACYVGNKKGGSSCRQKKTGLSISKTPALGVLRLRAHRSDPPDGDWQPASPGFCRHPHTSAGAAHLRPDIAGAGCSCSGWRIRANAPSGLSAWRSGWLSSRVGRPPPVHHRCRRSRLVAWRWCWRWLLAALGETSVRTAGVGDDDAHVAFTPSAASFPIESPVGPGGRHRGQHALGGARGPGEQPGHQRARRPDPLLSGRPHRGHRHGSFGGPASPGRGHRTRILVASALWAS